MIKIENSIAATKASPEKTILATSILVSNSNVCLGIAARFERKRRDKPQHIAQAFQDGELPVSAVTTAGHGPGDEGSCRDRPEGGALDVGAALEGLLSDAGQTVGKRQGRDPTALLERTCANSG